MVRQEIYLSVLELLKKRIWEFIFIMLVSLLVRCHVFFGYSLICILR